MTKKVKVAVIGAGNMGRHHVRNYAELDAAELLAVADSNPDTAKLAAEHGAKHYTDYIKMLDEVRPDAVSVVVPTPYHLEVGRAVLSRGIHMLIEKPIASSVEEATELMVLAKQQKVIFTVGHIERYNPVVRKLKELIDEGRVGKVTSVISKRVGGFPKVEPKTDVIVDLAIHDIDIISYLLGKHPLFVSSHGSRTIHSQKLDSAEILLDYGHASGFIQANWVTPVKIRTIAVTGSDGYIDGNYITQELHYYKHVKQPSAGFKEFVADLGDPQKELIPVDFQEPLAAELSVFLGAIQGKVFGRLVEPADAKEALRVALKAVGQSNGGPSGR